MLDTLGGRGRGRCREDSIIVYQQDEEGSCHASEMRACWRGVWEEVESSRPWYPLAVDDTGRMSTRPR